MNLRKKLVFAFLALTAFDHEQSHPLMVAAIRDQEEFEDDFTVVEELQDLADSGDLTTWRTYVSFMFPAPIINATDKELRVIEDGTIIVYNRNQVALQGREVICNDVYDRFFLRAALLSISDTYYAKIESDISYSMGTGGNRQLL
ncbi:MAG: hypothetical protein SGILL_003716, partial [Bacillariaceae sp.]